MTAMSRGCNQEYTRKSVARTCKRKIFISTAYLRRQILPAIMPRFFYIFAEMLTWLVLSLLFVSGAPNENIVQNHLNIALLNVF